LDFIQVSVFAEVKVKRIIAGMAFRSEFLVGWCYDADTTMAAPELY